MQSTKICYQNKIKFLNTIINKSLMIRVGWYILEVLTKLKACDNPWWRHQTETFSALLSIGTGNSPVAGEIPAERPVTRRFDVLFDLCLNKRLRKQLWGWWFETPSRPLLRHCNANGLWPLDALSHDHELRKHVCIIMCFINTLSVDKMVDIWKKRFYVFLFF